MFRKMDFYKFVDKIGVLNYIWWLFVINLTFWVTMLPCLIIFLFFELNLMTMVLMFFSFFLLGPSLASVFYTLLKLQEDDAKIVKNYFRFFRRNFFRFFKYCTPFIFILGVIAFNLFYTSQLGQLNLLRLGNMFLVCIFVTFLFNFILVAVKYETSFKETIKICLQLMFVKSIRFNGNFLILLSTFVLLSYAPIYLVLYGISIACFLSVKNFQSFWKEEESTHS